MRLLVCAMVIRDGSFASSITDCLLADHVKLM